MIFDTKLSASDFLTNVNVVKEKVISTMTIETYMDLSENQITTVGFTVLEKKTVQLDKYKAGQMVIKSDTLKAKEVMYIIKEKNTMWVITYATGIRAYDGLVATFAQSANTFRVQP